VATHNVKSLLSGKPFINLFHLFYVTFDTHMNYTISTRSFLYWGHSLDQQPATVSISLTLSQTPAYTVKQWIYSQCIAVRLLSSGYYLDGWLSANR